VNPAHRRLRQEDGEFVYSLVYIVRTCLKKPKPINQIITLHNFKIGNYFASSRPNYFQNIIMQLNIFIHLKVKHRINFKNFGA
jgi:hypothetical protein